MFQLLLVFLLSVILLLIFLLSVMLLVTLVVILPSGRFTFPRGILGKTGSLRAASERPLAPLFSDFSLDLKEYSSFSSNDESRMFLVTAFKEDDLILFEFLAFLALTSLAMRLTTLFSPSTLSVFSPTTLSVFWLPETHTNFCDCRSGDGEGRRLFDLVGDLDFLKPGEGDLDVLDELKEGTGELDNLEGGLDNEDDRGDGHTEENEDDEVDVEDIQVFEDVFFFTSELS